LYKQKDLAFALINGTNDPLVGSMVPKRRQLHSKRRSQLGRVPRVVHVDNHEKT
jgi:hypothetical protein